MAHNYGREKFYLATLCLATGEGSIHARLESAAVALSVIEPTEDLPVTEIANFEQMWRELTAREAESDFEGKIGSTVRQLDPNDAASLAERIFDMYFRVLGVHPL